MHTGQAWSTRAPLSAASRLGGPRRVLTYRDRGLSIHPARICVSLHGDALSGGEEHELQTGAAARGPRRGSSHARLRRPELRSPQHVVRDDAQPARLQPLDGDDDETDRRSTGGRAEAPRASDVEPARDAGHADEARRLLDQERSWRDRSRRGARLACQAQGDLQARQDRRGSRAGRFEADRRPRPCGHLPAGAERPEGRQRRWPADRHAGSRRGSRTAGRSGS